MPKILQVVLPEESLADTALLFASFADPARLRILNLIGHAGEICNCHIETITGYLPSKISRHLAILRQAGFVRERRAGIFVHYSLAPRDDRIGAALLKLIDELPRAEELLQSDLEALRAHLANRC
jgi:ArsR family transcriptional regulator